MNSQTKATTALLTGALLTGALLGAPTLHADDGDRLLRRAARYFEPLPERMPGAENDTPERVELGRRLYVDTRLSVNDTLSCATCHPVEGRRAGMDNLPTSPGAHGELGSRNTPTVLNAGWQVAQFWDGRAKDLAEQAGQPILNPIEMAMPGPAAVVEKLAALAGYPEAFAAAFPGSEPALSYAHLTEAIAAFERTLRREARFDDYLRGEQGALTALEQRGLDTFLRTNCVRCHDGPLVGGGVLEKLGAEHPFPNARDQGRFAVTGKEEDRMLFKVPSLRNVALTEPWFHDGSVENLGEAVRMMAWMQLDTQLKDEEVEAIVAFLHALTDKTLEEGR